MPFKKPATRANLQPIDARKIFIGRHNELHFFIHDILEPDEATHNIVSISGQGGVGKSTLVNRFIDEAHATNFKDYCFTALVNERQITPTSIMERFAEQLHLEGDFKKALSQYKETVYKLRSEREAMRDVFLNKAPGLAGIMLEDIPVAGKLLKEGTEAAAEYFITRYRSQQLLKDAERLEDPIGDLTSAFVKELNLLADTPRTHHQRRVILFFDTFEQLAPDAAPWLLDHFLEADVSTNVIMVVAGRDSIEDSTPEDPKRWLPYLDAGTIHFIPLNIFDEEETRAYLQERSITDLTQVTQLWHLSRGLPLYLGILTSNPHGKVDPTANVVDNFLRWIPEQDQIKRRLALDASLFTMPFNKDDLSAFHYLEQERDALFTWLISQPFIRSNPQDGRYTYHEIAQELFSRYLYQRSPDECCETRRALVRHYQKRLEDTEKDGGEKVYESARWQELALALTQQLFFLPDENSHLKGLEQTFTAYYHCKSEREGEIARVLREICREEKIFQISTGAHEIVGQLLIYIEYREAKIESEEFLNAGNYVLGKAIHILSFPAKPLAFIYSNRGENYRLRGKTQLAIADFNQSLQLRPDNAWTYGSRGQAYYALKEYQHAIEDLNYAIVLEPDYSWAFVKRGNAYRALNEKQQAIESYSDAINLDPDDSSAFAQRGFTYRLLEDYQPAIADFDRALVLDPNNSWTFAQRGGVYCLLEDYQHAIADFDRAIALNPTYVWALAQRGEVYRLLEDYQHAIADFDRAITLSSNDAWAYASRGQAYSSLKDYQHALSDLDRALDLDPALDWAYASRGEVYRLLKDYQLAVADFDRAIALDPNNSWVFAQRGEVYRLLKDYQLAIADFDRALSLDPHYDWALAQRGFTYRLLEDYQLAIADFDRAITLSSNYAWALAQRGFTYRLLEDYQLAIADFDRALALDPNYAWALAQRGVTYCLLEDYQPAIADFDRALDLDPALDWAYASRGQAYSSLKDYQLAIADFTRAIDLDPNDAWAIHQRSMAYLYLKDYQIALEGLDQAIKIDPTDIELPSIREFIYLFFIKNDVVNAINARFKILRADSMDISNNLLLEWINMGPNRPNLETAHRLKTISTTNPNCYEAYVCMGIASWLHKYYEQALEELTQAFTLALDDEKWEVYFWQGIIFASLMQDKKAIEALEMAMSGLNSSADGLVIALVPLMLAPLRWFEQDRPDFYAQHIVPLLARFT